MAVLKSKNNCKNKRKWQKKYQKAQQTLKQPLIRHNYIERFLTTGFFLFFLKK